MGYLPVKKETQELYLKIWTQYVLTSASQGQLAASFGCSTDTVYNALNWVAEHKIQLQPTVFIEVAKDVIKNKLQELNGDIAKIKETQPVNWNGVIGLEKIILCYRDLLWKFQGIVRDKNTIQINMPESPEQSEVDKLLELFNSSGFTQEEKDALLDRLEKRDKELANEEQKALIKKEA